MEEDSKSSDITATNIQDEILGPLIIEEYRKEVPRRKKNDKDMDVLAGYTSSISQDLEICL